MKTSQSSPYFFGIYIVILLIVIGAAWLQSSVPLIILFRDTFTLGGITPHHGLFSNIGSFLWCAIGSITLFSSAILFASRKDQEFATFLLAFSLISLFSMIDDFFMFHEHIAPVLLHISEKTVLGMYGIAIIASTVRFRKTILKTNWKIFAIGLLFFFLSLVFDKLLDGQENTVYLFKIGEKYIFEDGAKFLGIAIWLYYFSTSSFNQILRPLSEHKLHQNFSDH